MGKVMLVVLLPFLFTVIGTILVAAILSVLGALSGYNTFSHCFTATASNEKLVTIMLGIGSIFTIIYIAVYE